MKIERKDHRLSGIVLIVMLCMTMSSYALNPAQALENAKNKISAAKTITSDFILSSGGNTVKGKLSCKGTKFALTSSAVSSWYDGKSLYTYNPANSETYLYNPTPAELAEANPLLYLNSVADYNIAAAKTPKAGVETVVLLPKKNGTSVKSVTLEIDSKTFLPKLIRVVPSSGSAIQITLSNVKLNGSVGDSTFEYPKSKYPKVPVVDMR